MLDKDIVIYETESIIDALKRLDRSGRRLLLVIDGDYKLLGTLSDGDVRRYILKGNKLEDAVKDVYNRSPIYMSSSEFSQAAAKAIMAREKIQLLPIVDSGKKVVDFVTWDNIFLEEGTSMPAAGRIDVPVVLMAGGMGTRLEPFSKILPKPLIPIGEKPIVELIIEEFKKHGVNKFYLTLNYKAEMIISYFNNIEKDYSIEYVREDGFFGTAGSLKALGARTGETFIVSNCDVLVKANLEDVIDFHKKQGALLTVLSSIQHHKIPYGVIKFRDGGKVVEIVEKPEYPLTVNTGVYILNREALDFIPAKTRFDMTDLINALIKASKTVITYPVNENDYTDIGQWEEYKKVIDKLQFLK